MTNKLVLLSLTVNAILFCSYMFSLNPEINRGRFTVEEDCVLMAAVKEYGQNFHNFPTNLLPGRDTVQIRSRYNNVLKHVGKREHWSLEHDITLNELVAKYGESNWAKIAQEIRFHNRTSCRSRYTTIVKFLKKHPNSKIEDVPRRKRAFSTNVTADNWMETIIKEKHRDFGDENDDDDDYTYAKDRTYSNVSSNVIGSAYYKYFRYAYNFRFGERIIANENIFENLQIVCQLLDVSDSTDFVLPRENFDGSFSDYITYSIEVPRITLECEFANSLHQMGKNDFTFPINLNTIIGLRAFVILFESDELIQRKGPRDMFGQLLVPKSEPSTSSACHSTNRMHPALHQFRRRFISLFKNAAMLAKATNLTRMKTGPRVKLKRASAFSSTAEAETSATSDVDLVNETIIIYNNESQQRIQELLSTGGSNEIVRVTTVNDNNEWNNANKTSQMMSSPSDEYSIPTQAIDAIAMETDYDYTLETNNGTYQIKVLNSNHTDDESALGTLKRERECIDKLSTMHSSTKTPRNQ